MSDNKKIEEIKEKILQREEIKKIYLHKFSKIEEKIKQDLTDRKTDDALYDLTIGALYLGVSDIHYEAFEKDVAVRFRIDGLLVNVFHFTHKEYKSILERLKYSANLKLNITNIPQDGKYSLKVKLKDKNNFKKIDVRISTLPTKYGENVVSRILDSSKAIVNFEDLGFFWTGKRMLEKAIKKNSGMILVTGPTGSGKTTTLYTILNKLNTSEKKIITLEDPIEYELNGIIQSEVDEKKGFTFESGLKALLRQDPDVIMVGEIRGIKTLDIATQASLTGHLVLSTLHTKSAAETLNRIINMGLKPYILASALDTIIAQRLVRKICDNCKIEKEKSSLDIAIIKAMMEDIGMGSIPVKNIKLYKGIGCEKCGNTGYYGRIGLFEIISLNEKLRILIRNGSSTKEIIEEGRKSDFISMKEDGILKAIKGYTTLEEVLRVI